MVTSGQLNSKLLDELKSEYQYGEQLCGMMTLMQDLIACLLIGSNRQLSGQSGPLGVNELMAVKQAIKSRYPYLSDDQAWFAEYCIDFYAQEYAAAPDACSYHEDDLTLKDLPELVTERLSGQCEMDFFLETLESSVGTQQ